MRVQNVRRSNVFVIRIWTEDRGQNSYEWRGMVRELQSGETRYFQSWEEFATFMDQHVEAQERRDCHAEDS